MISLQQLLFEEPEFGADAVFGKYIFDDPRTDIPRAAKEKMTPLEDDILKSIGTYINHNSPLGLSKRAEVLLNLVDKGYYSPILDPGTAPVYRLLMFSGPGSKDEISAIVGPAPKKTGILGPGVLNPTYGKIQGWSTGMDYIKKFLTFKRTGRDDCMIVFKANPQDNKFFGKPGKLAAVAGEDERYVQEMETISYGPVSYTEARYVFPGYVHDFSLSVEERMSISERRKEDARWFLTFQTNEVPVW